MAVSKSSGQNLGGHVIRNNTIEFQYVGDGSHGEDCILHVPNTAYSDSFKDTDIHGNLCIGATDDGIELDGNNVNTRVWENIIVGSNVGFSIGASAVGPTYVFRNVVYDLAWHWTQCLGIKEGKGGAGHVFFYHNTFYVTGGGCGAHAPQGVGLGKLIADSAGLDPASNIVLKNNIFYFAEQGFLISKAVPNDLESDYNLHFDEDGGVIATYDGVPYLSLADLITATGLEQNSLVGDPLFVGPDTGNFNLGPGSPAIDVGVIIEGFNDPGSPWTYLGAAPDLGAFETSDSTPPGLGPAADPPPDTGAHPLSADATGFVFDVISVTQGTNGSVSINADGTVTYTPSPTFDGSDSFTYELSDGALTDTGTVSVTVLAVNDAPVAVDDVATTAEDTPVNVDVLSNDTDADGDSLTVASVTQGINGSVSINADGTVGYTPGPNFNGSDSFTYELSDGALTDTAAVSITVLAVNDAPLAADDVATTPEDTAVTVDVLSNDTDVDGDSLTVASVTQGANGSVSINVDGTVSYAPSPDFNGSDSFTYELSDGALTDTAAVSITVLAVNDAPLAADDVATTAEDTPVNVDVLSNDTDVDGDSLTVASVTQGANGSVSINVDGTVSYAPSLDFNGSDSFTYELSDGALTDTAAVSITVLAVNDAPLAADDVATTAEDTPVNVDVLSNDTDVDGDSLTVASVTHGANGSVSINADNTVTYTPASGFSGSDSFTYVPNDGSTDGNVATASVTVAVNPPAAVDKTISTDEDATIAVALGASDIGTCELGFTVVTGPANGALSGITGQVCTPGSPNIDTALVTYSPDLNFNGSDSFVYRVTDTNGAFGDATVSVTVLGVNDSPLAADDVATTTEDTPVNVDVLSNDTDVDGDSLTVASVTQGANGSVSINADGTVGYTPGPNFNGSDSFTYELSDGALTDTAAVSITVLAVNDAPLAADDVATTAEDTPVNVDVLSNDTDVDGDSLTVASVTHGANGSVSINADNTVTYTPASGFSGSDSFTYVPNDGSTDGNVATVSVTVIPDTVPPIRSGGSPSGTLPSGTTETTLSLSTDEKATCRYDSSPATSYGLMPNTFANTSSTAHSTLVSGLSGGSAFEFFVKCQDPAGNANTDDYGISFDIATGLGAFEDGFETGDLSQWTSSLTEPGNTLEVTNTAAMVGSYGLRVKTTGLNDDATAQKQLPGVSQIYTRTSVKLVSDVSQGNPQLFMAAASASWGGYVGALGTRRKFGDLNNNLYTFGGGSFSDTGLDLDVNTWYCVETYFSVSPTAGRIKVWVDGALIADRQNLNTGSALITWLRLGADGPRISSEYYFDDFKTSDAARVGCATP